MAWQSKPQVSKKMTTGHIDAIFNKFNDNGDGKMSRKEFKTMMATQSKKGVEGGLVQGQSPAGSRPQSPAPSKRPAPATSEATE